MPAVERPRRIDLRDWNLFKRLRRHVQISRYGGRSRANHSRRWSCYEFFAKKLRLMVFLVLVMAVAVSTTSHRRRVSQLQRRGRWCNAICEPDDGPSGKYLRNRIGRRTDIVPGRMRDSFQAGSLQFRVAVYADLSSPGIPTAAVQELPLAIGPDGSLYGTTFEGGNSICYPSACGTRFSARGQRRIPATRLVCMERNGDLQFRAERAGRAKREHRHRSGGKHLRNYACRLLVYKKYRRQVMGGWEPSCTSLMGMTVRHRMEGLTSGNLLRHHLPGWRQLLV